MTDEISHRKSIQIADTEFVHHMVPHKMGVIKKHLQAIERIKKKGYGDEKYLFCETELPSSDLTSSQVD